MVDQAAALRQQVHQAAPAASTPEAVARHCGVGHKAGAVHRGLRRRLARTACAICVCFSGQRAARPTALQPAALSGRVPGVLRVLRMLCAGGLLPSPLLCLLLLRCPLLLGLPLRLRLWLRGCPRLLLVRLLPVLLWRLRLLDGI